MEPAPGKQIRTQREAIDDLISHLKERREKGELAVSIEGLIRLLSGQQRAFSDQPRLSLADYVQHHMAFKLAEYHIEAEAMNRLFDSVVTAGKEAIQSLLVINGGGCVALLALMGQLAPKLNGGDLVHAFGVPLLGFACGLVAASLLACLSYLTQSAYNAKRPKAAKIIRWLAIIMGVVSLSGFAFGSFSAFQGLSKMQFVRGESLA
jgi:hypothetical protein